jgi:hypothetical protein
MIWENIVFLAPAGQYHVRADPAASDSSAFEKRGAVPEKYDASVSAVCPDYFPNGSKPGARRIDSRGRTSTGVDMRLNEVRAHRISGVLSILGAEPQAYG